MTRKKLRLLAASIAAVMLIGGTGTLLAACGNNEETVDPGNNITPVDPGNDDKTPTTPGNDDKTPTTPGNDDKTPTTPDDKEEDQTPVSNVKKYTYTSKNLLEDDLEFFTLMMNGMGDETTGIMPIDNWGSAKFTSIRHTITLEIGTVGLADEEGYDLSTAIDSNGLVDFATGDSETALKSVNLVKEEIKSGWGDNQTITQPIDDIHKCNYKFTLTTTLKGNGASDGYQGTGTCVYVWYGITDTETVEEDGYYTLPVSTFAEMYVTGDLSHGTSTTSIMPDAGFYINSLMGTHLMDETFAYAEHVGGTDPTIVYVSPKSLGMMYFNRGDIYIDEETGKIVDTDVKHYTPPVSLSSFELAKPDGTVVNGETINLAVGEAITLSITPNVSTIYTLVATPDTEGIVTTAFDIENGQTAKEITITAQAAGTVVLSIATDRGVIITETVTIVVE